MENHTLLCLRPGAKDMIEMLLGFRGQRTVLTAGEKWLSEGRAICSGPSWQSMALIGPSPRDWDVAAAGRSAGAGGPLTGHQVSARDTVGREQLPPWRCADRLLASRTIGRPDTSLCLQASLSGCPWHT